MLLQTRNDHKMTYISSASVGVSVNGSISQSVCLRVALNRAYDSPTHYTGTTTTTMAAISLTHMSVSLSNHSQHRRATILHSQPPCWPSAFGIDWLSSDPADVLWCFWCVPWPLIKGSWSLMRSMRTFLVPVT